MAPGESWDGTLEWRVKTLEALQHAMQLDIYNERVARESSLREVRKDIREEYMTRDQLANTYINKKDVLVTKREKREWWALIPVWVAGGLAVADIVLRASGH